MSGYNTIASRHFIHTHGTTIESKKNIVFFWLESLEQGYLDDNLYPGLTPHINGVKDKSYSFTDIISPIGTTWSMAGVVGQSCGVPLVAFSTRKELALTNDFSGDAFLPLADCMQDILARSGYQNHYISGADLNFAGFINFMESHSFTSLTGYQAILKKYPTMTREGWGIRDSDVLQVAIQDYKELSKQDKPFSLFVETSDTHIPAIPPNKYCLNHLYPRYKDDITQESYNTLHAIHCLDQSIGRFLEVAMPDIEAGKTMVVFASDHRSVSGLVNPVDFKNRRDIEAAAGKNTFIIIDKDLGKGINNSRASVLDIGATILGRFDETIKGIGYGRNLFKEQSLRELQDNLDLFIRQEIPFISSLWHWPQSAETFEFSGSYLLMNDQVFSFPISMILDKKGYIRHFLFKEINKELLDSLLEELSGTDGHYYLSINKCSENTEFYQNIKEGRIEKDYCALYGNSENGVELLELNGSDTLTVHQENGKLQFLPEQKKYQDLNRSVKWPACKTSVIYNGNIIQNCLVEIGNIDKLPQHMLSLYFSRDPGDYSVTLTYSSPEESVQPVANWQIDVRATANTRFAEGTFYGSQNKMKSITGNFTITPEQAGRANLHLQNSRQTGQEFELAVFVSSKADFKMESIEITRLK